MRHHKSVLFVSEIKSFDTDFLVRVVGKAGRQVWGKFSKKDFKKIEEIIPKLEGSLDIIFRPGLEFVFEDKDLLKKIPLSQISDFSKMRSKDLVSQKEVEIFEYVELPSVMIKERKIMGFRINSKLMRKSMRQILNQIITILHTLKKFERRPRAQKF